MKKVLFIFILLTLALSACGPQAAKLQMNVLWTKLVAQSFLPDRRSKLVWAHRY